MSCSLASCYRYHHLSARSMGAEEIHGSRPNLCKDDVENIDTACKCAQIAHERVHDSREGCQLGVLDGRVGTLVL